MSSHRDQSVLPSPSGPVLCATGCGFFGNPNTDNLCSKCNADRKRQQAASSSSAITPATSTTTSTSTSSPAITSTPSTPSIAPLAITNSPTTFTSTSTSTAPTMTLDTASSPAVTTPTPSPAPITSTSSSEAPTTTPKKKLNRCGVCSKKVGITYFNCRCDDALLLCSAHRLPHQHDCKFDVKKLHAANLTKANPEIIRAKMEKI